MTGKWGDRRVTGRERGQGLAGLSVTLAVAGTLTALTIPGLQGILAGARVKATAARFMSDVHLARSEAIRERRQAVLCPSADGTRCLPEGTWHRGWIVFEDLDGDREHSVDERLHRAVTEQPGVSLVTSLSRRRLVMRPTGFSPGSNGTYTVCPGSGNVVPVAIIVANNGRARLSRTRPDGGELRCDGN